MNYKIFNEECYIECPNDTAEKDGHCLCLFSYYNKSNHLICFSSDKHVKVKTIYLKSQMKKNVLITKKNVLKEILKYLIIYVMKNVLSIQN